MTHLMRGLRNGCNTANFCRSSRGTQQQLPAFRNAFIVLDSGGDAAHRTNGYLFSVELFGSSTPVSVVPKWVSTVSAAQKLASVLFVFMFGLAVQNMLKMK
jgi:hypothetical protein